jgi:hypothetical protein
MKATAPAFGISVPQSVACYKATRGRHSIDDFIMIESETAKDIIQGHGMDDVGAVAVCRKMGVSQATFSRWMKVYDALVPSEVRKLRMLEEVTLAVARERPLATLIATGP